MNNNINDEAKTKNVNKENKNENENELPKVLPLDFFKSLKIHNQNVYLHESNESSEKSDSLSESSSKDINDEINNHDINHTTNDESVLKKHNNKAKNEIQNINHRDRSTHLYMEDHQNVDNAEKISDTLDFNEKPKFITKYNKTNSKVKNNPTINKGFLPKAQHHKLDKPKSNIQCPQIEHSYDNSNIFKNSNNFVFDNKKNNKKEKIKKKEENKSELKKKIFQLQQQLKMKNDNKMIQLKEFKYKYDSDFILQFKKLSVPEKISILNLPLNNWQTNLPTILTADDYDINHINEHQAMFIGKNEAELGYFFDGSTKFRVRIKDSKLKNTIINDIWLPGSIVKITEWRIPYLTKQLSIKNCELMMQSLYVLEDQGREEQKAILGTLLNINIDQKINLKDDSDDMLQAYRETLPDDMIKQNAMQDMSAKKMKKDNNMIQLTTCTKEDWHLVCQLMKYNKKARSTYSYDKKTYNQQIYSCSDPNCNNNIVLNCVPSTVKTESYHLYLCNLNDNVCPHQLHDLCQYQDIKLKNENESQTASDFNKLICKIKKKRHNLSNVSDDEVKFNSLDLIGDVIIIVTSLHIKDCRFRMFKPNESFVIEFLITKPQYIVKLINGLLPKTSMEFVRYFVDTYYKSNLKLNLQMEAKEVSNLKETFDKIFESTSFNYEILDLSSLKELFKRKQFLGDDDKNENDQMDSTEFLKYSNRGLILHKVDRLLDGKLGIYIQSKLMMANLLIVMKSLGYIKLVFDATFDYTNLKQLVQLTCIETNLGRTIVVGMQISKKSESTETQTKMLDNFTDVSIRFITKHNLKQNDNIVFKIHSVIGDGHLGITSAIRISLPGTLREQCVFHKLQNLVGEIRNLGGKNEILKKFFKTLFWELLLMNNRQNAMKHIRLNKEKVFLEIETERNIERKNFLNSKKTLINQIFKWFDESFMNCFDGLAFVNKIQHTAITSNGIEQRHSGMSKDIPNKGTISFENYFIYFQKQSAEATSSDKDYLTNMELSVYPHISPIEKVTCQQMINRFQNLQLQDKLNSKIQYIKRPGIIYSMYTDKCNKIPLLKDKEQLRDVFLQLHIMKDVSCLDLQSFSKPTELQVKFMKSSEQRTLEDSYKLNAISTINTNFDNHLEWSCNCMDWIRNGSCFEMSMLYLIMKKEDWSLLDNEDSKNKIYNTILHGVESTNLNKIQEE